MRPGIAYGQWRRRAVVEKIGVMNGPVEDEYRAIAASYDRVIGPWIRPLRRRVARIAVAQGWCRVLDLCAGTGEQAGFLARAGVKVVACDLSSAMLAQAAAKHGAEVPLVQADAARLCFADQSFDAVVISFALHEKESDARRAILGEVRRVLTATGRLLTIDYEPPATGLSRWAHGLVGCLERGAGRHHYACFKNFMDQGGNRKVLEQAGYVVLGWRLHLFGTVSLALANIF